MENARQSIARASMSFKMNDSAREGQQSIEIERLKTTLDILNQKLKVAADENGELKTQIDTLNQDLSAKD